MAQTLKGISVRGVLKLLKSNNWKRDNKKALRHPWCSSYCSLSHQSLTVYILSLRLNTAFIKKVLSVFSINIVKIKIQIFAHCIQIQQGAKVYFLFSQIIAVLGVTCITRNLHHLAEYRERTLKFENQSIWSFWVFETDLKFCSCPNIRIFITL